MKKALALLLSMMMIAVTLLAGCGGNNSNSGNNGNSGNASEISDSSDKAGGPKELVIIVGKHANAKKPDPEIIRNRRSMIEDCFEITQDGNGYKATAHITVIVSDGKPGAVRITGKNGEDILTCSANVIENLKSRVSQRVNEIIDFLVDDNLRADDPEVDMVGALTEAGKVFASSKLNAYNLLVLDTGISTAGSFDMNSPVTDMMKMSNEEILNVLSDKLPRFPENTSVEMIGLGDVCGTQGAFLDAEMDNRFVDFMTSLFDKTGAVLKEKIVPAVHQQGSTDASGKSNEMIYTETNTLYPYVHSVILYDATKPNVVPAPISLNPEAFAVKLDSGVCQFEPDSAEFKDENQVNTTLNTLKGALEDYINKTNYKLYVVGSIAKISPDSDHRSDEVSAARAAAIAEKLVKEYEVPENRVAIIDAGTTKFSWRAAEEFPNGQQDDEAMEKNRVVAIIGQNATDQFNELKSAGYIS